MISATYHRAGCKTKAQDFFHQRFNIASACFEVKTTTLFIFCVGVTLGVD
jgi:hypothetical protein